MHESINIRVVSLGDGVYELCFDRRDATVNTLDHATLHELHRAVRWLSRQPGLAGVLITSAKQGFVAGADIREFAELFALPEAELAARNLAVGEAACALEDLDVPTVCAINGFALGGGFELALSCALRVMSTRAQVGLPEVSLGLIPGLGGTVRAPRVAGPAVAADLISEGRPRTAEQALAQGLVDAVCAPDDLRAVALEHLRSARAGCIDWHARVARKRALPPGDVAAHERVLLAARIETAAHHPPHQPAALAAVELMGQCSALPRAQALVLEAQCFCHLAKSQAADALVQAFFSNQAVKKRGREQAANARPVHRAAVLGAGIMGRGIAYSSALHGVVTRIKDVQPAALDNALAEADRLLARQQRAGRLDAAQAQDARGRLTAQLDLEGFEQADLVVEAVTERLGLKRDVLADVERLVGADTVIASNTSSLRIDDIAAALRHPERLVGLHFFNPAPAMSLVEVVRGAKTSEATLATAVGYARTLGKTPVVVRDCPGFLVNRVLTPYMLAANRLIAEGVDYERIDRVMQAFGWPMGPAWLQDVIGLDTAAHVWFEIAAGYPQRMARPTPDPLDVLLQSEHRGQKNGRGFYLYTPDAQGRMARQPNFDMRGRLGANHAQGARCSDDEIVERLMLPLVLEAAQALADGVVDTPAELDTALRLGIGVPPHLGGPLKYADWLGLDELLRACERHAALGPAYVPGPDLRERAATGRRYYA